MSGARSREHDRRGLAVNRLREDVHIHASAQAVYRALSALDGHGEWLPPRFRDYDASGTHVSFELALPLRRERARLRVAADEAPELLVLAQDGDAAGAVTSLTWALHEESPAEVHLTLEAEYRPAGGPLGALLEPALYRPLRRQAFRDALWRLKLAIEGPAGPSQ